MIRHRHTLSPVVLTVLTLLASVSLGGVVTGCKTSSCDTAATSNPFVDYRDGKVHQLDGGPVYESAPPDGQLLGFSQGAQIRIFHHLEGRPIHIELWVSFSPTGTKDGNGNLAEPAGNMAEVLKWDDEVIEITNSTCGDYYLRVVASDPLPKDQEAP